MTLSDAWDPEQYERYARERRQPFEDLLSMVHSRPGLRAVDLGCGTGETTRELHRHLAARETVGLDSSPAMLQRAEPLAGGGLRFVQGEIENWAPERPVDLVFSNAALHWVDDHERLFARLARTLTERGQLAVQMPANHDQPTHREAAAVADEEPFASALGGARRVVPVLAPEAYSALLHGLGFARQHVRLQVYPHLLASRDDVVEWVKGTTLTWYQTRLSEELFARFLERYRERLLQALPDTRPHFFPFKRVLLWGQKGPISGSGRAPTP